MMNKYLNAPYVDGGRGPFSFDCWGLCIAVRSEMLGLPLLPSLGSVGKDRIRENTRAYRELRAGMDECQPEVGAIAAVLRGKSLLHVGVVVRIDGRLRVLDTNPGGACQRTIRDFESAYPRVVYYRDRILPQ